MTLNESMDEAFKAAQECNRDSRGGYARLIGLYEAMLCRLARTDEDEEYVMAGLQRFRDAVKEEA